MKYTDVLCLTGEEWRAIPGYDGLYEASSFGRIRTAEGKTTHSAKHGKRIWKQRILKNKTKIPAKSGYMVTLWKNKKPKDLLVARIVCMTFHGIVTDNMTVNHKDGNRFNNNTENLEWLTLSDNIRHAFGTGLMPTKSVVLISPSGNRLKFKSYAVASRWLGKNSSYLSNAIVQNDNIYNKEGALFTLSGELT